MAQPHLWGSRGGPSHIRRLLVGNTGAIVAGDILVEDGGGVAYVMQATAAHAAPRGVALHDVPQPTNDGDAYVDAECHPQHIFEYPVDSGQTAAESDINKVCDIGAAQSIDILASAQDNVTIRDVDTDRNSVFVQINFDASRTGVA